MSGAMLHGLGDCTPEANCGCMSFDPQDLHVAELVRALDDERADVAELTVALREANDARFALVAHIERLHEAVKRVKALHEPIDALNVRHDRMQKVCTGCGTDDGNWQTWPCPTIRAITSEADR